MINDIVRQDIDTICTHLGDRAEVFSGKAIAVTGGAGFMGSYFVDVFCNLNDTVLSPPCRIISIDNYSTGSIQRLDHLANRQDIEFIDADIAKGVPLDETAHYIIHSASIASPIVYRQHPLETIEVNVIGTWHLLKYALDRNVDSILYLSSSEIYGDPTEGNVPTAETYWGNVSSTGPRACYDESKRLAETLCTNYYRQHKLPVKIVRPFNVYGPRLILDDGRVVPDLINDALNDRALTLYSNGLSTRSFCYISDAIRLMLDILLSNHDGDAFNVGNDVEITINELAEEIKHLFGGRLEIAHKVHSDKDYLTDNPQRRCVNIAKAKNLLDYEPRIDLATGLSRTIKSYQEKGIK